MAHGVKAFQFGGLELDLEARLDGDDKVDVVEGIPLLDVGCGEGGGKDEGFVVEEIADDGGELGVDLGWLHLLA